MQSVKQSAVPVFEFNEDLKSGQYYKLGPGMGFEVVTPKAKSEKLPTLVGVIRRESIAVLGDSKKPRLEVKPEVLAGHARDGQPQMQRNELALNAAYNVSILRALQHYARQHAFESDMNYIPIEMQLSQRAVLALPPADFATMVNRRIGGVQDTLLRSGAAFDKESMAAIDEALAKKVFTGDPNQVRTRTLTYLHQERRRIEREVMDESIQRGQLMREGKVPPSVTNLERSVKDEVLAKVDQYIAAAIRDLDVKGGADPRQSTGASSASSSRAQQSFDDFKDNKLVRSQLAKLDRLWGFISARLPPGSALPTAAFEAAEDSLGSSDFEGLFQPLERSVREFQGNAQATMAEFEEVLEELTTAIFRDQERHLELTHSIVGLAPRNVASMVDGLVKLKRQNVPIAEVQSRACAILLEQNLQQRVPTGAAPSTAQCHRALALAVEQMTIPGKELLDYDAVLARRGCRIEIKDGKFAAVGPKNAAEGLDKMEGRYQYNAKKGFYDLPTDTTLAPAEVRRNLAANDPIVMALAKGLQDRHVPAEPYAKFFEAAKRAAQLPPKVFASQVARALKQVDEAWLQRRLDAMPPVIEPRAASSLTASSSNLSSSSTDVRPGSPSIDLPSSRSFASEPSLEQSSQARRLPSAREVAPSSTPEPRDAKGLGSRTVAQIAPGQVGPGHSRIPRSMILPDSKAAHAILRGTKAEALVPLVPALLDGLLQWAPLQQRLVAANGLPKEASASLIKDMREAAATISTSLAISDLASTVVKACLEFSRLPPRLAETGPGALRLHQASLKIQTQLAALALESGMTLEDLDAAMQPPLPLVPLADYRRDMKFWGDKWGEKHEEMIEKTELSRRAKQPAPPLSEGELNALLEDVRASRATLFPENINTPDQGELVAEGLVKVLEQLDQLEDVLAQPGAAEQSIEVFEKPIGMLAGMLELVLEPSGETE